ncbi:hypothetical protein LX36DRAFT_183488 [Colletotrichum falcatum]|nr:hypothetical protein LX36DRAFT_183488 [Colletotrichum falcatum]
MTVLFSFFLFVGKPCLGSSPHFSANLTSNGFFLYTSSAWLVLQTDLFLPFRQYPLRVFFNWSLLYGRNSSLESPILRLGREQDLHQVSSCSSLCLNFAQ